MKKTILLLFIVIVMPGLAADSTSDENPEFYFTRLVYSGGRGRGFGGGGFGGFGAAAGRERQCSTLEAGEGGSGMGFGAWATDYPASDCKYMWGVERLTNIRVYDKSPNSIEIMDPRLFEFPYLYAVEVGNMELSDQEAERLREYFMRGGFMHADDYWGDYERDVFDYQMQKVFPDRSIQPIPLSHEVFHSFFDVDRIMQIPNISNGRSVGRGNLGARTWEDSSDTEPNVYGIFDDDGRLMVLMTYNSDLGDAWEWMDDPGYPEMFSSQAYRMGINFIVYAMTH